MSDFFDRLEDELTRAARRRTQARRPAFAAGWSRRTLVLAVLAALALVVVPGVAAVTGAFKAPKHKPPTRSVLPTTPGLVDAEPPCVSRETRKLAPSSDPPPAELTRVLGVLRRPQVPGDRLPLDRLAILPIRGVNPDAIRLARTVGRTRYFFVPAQNVRAFDEPRCNGVKPPKIKPEAGVCLLAHGLQGEGGWGGCDPISGILIGRSLATSGGSRHGTTHAMGIAPDGVKYVIWRVRRGSHFLDTHVSVVGNVWAGNLPGRAGHGLYVFFVYTDGRKKLVVGPHHFTKHELAVKRRDKALDRAAGPKPSVYPAVGSRKTLFTLRLRLAHPRARTIYVATIRGCLQVQHLGMTPALRGPERGLMRALIGPRPGKRWCRGVYKGTITIERPGRSAPYSGPVAGRFSFRVR